MVRPIKIRGLAKSNGIDFWNNNYKVSLTIKNGKINLVGNEMRNEKCKREARRIL